MEAWGLGIGWMPGRWLTAAKRRPPCPDMFYFNAGRCGVVKGLLGGTAGASDCKDYQVWGLGPRVWVTRRWAWF